MNSETSFFAPAAASVLRAVFPGESEMARRCRAFDWGVTPLGPVATWPASLTTTAALVLAAPVGMILLWGPELVQLYNDGYAAIMGAKHPGGLGQRNVECWPEVWDFTSPIYDAVLQRGESFRFEDQRLVLERSGAREETFFTLTYSPVPAGAEAGAAVGGILVLVIETTAEVRGRAAEAERARLAAVFEAERIQLLEDVFRQAPSFLAVYRGPDHVYTLANDAYYQLVGHGREIVGKPLLEALPEVRGQGFDVLLDGVLRTGEPFVAREIPVRLERTPGAPPEDRVVALTYLPLVDADGTRAGVIAHGADVTEYVAARREVERLLAESNAARRAELEAANAQLQDQALELELTNQQLQENAVELEVQAETLQASAAELELERARLAQVFRLAPSFLAVLRGPEQTYALINDAYRQLVGHRDVVGRPLLDALPELAGQGFKELLDRVRDTGEPWVGRDVPVRLQRVPGAPLETRYIDTVFQAMVEADGATGTRTTGVVAHGSDVTDQVLARREVDRLLASERAARAEAEAANRAKGEFLAVMSHELRTPLNAIGGYAELLEMGVRGPVTPEQRADLARIQRAQRHLLGLINGVLNYARVDAGAVHYEVADVDLAEVLAACEALVAPQVRAKGLALAHDAGSAPGGRPLRARADREKVQQVVLNLLSNAVKFTEPGGCVTLRCAAEPGWVLVRVADTGIGIAADQLARVFEPFVQVDQRFTRTQEGTGLGLAISRDLARGMGGELAAESVPGAGSTFTLRLPAA